MAPYKCILLLLLLFSNNEAKTGHVANLFCSLRGFPMELLRYQALIRHSDASEGIYLIINLIQ